MTTMKLTAMTALALAIGACTTGQHDVMPAGDPVQRVAVADLRTASNADVGTATVETIAGGGLRVTIDAHGMVPGPHGAHIHMTGRCDSPDFMTAGGHWNPGGTQHGSQNPAGPHAGDIPNLLIGADGRGTVAINLPSGTFDSLLDSDGAAMVVHAAADDLMTDPSGNSGARVACGVFNAQN